ncbi:MAG: thioredoxin [Alphaproteobacteria bacterium]|nr:thioredoxin [Alphaproteobacteria bacterium]
MEFIINQDGAAQPGATSARPAPAGDLIKESSMASFMADVIEASRHCLILVDFWATWCGPCKQLGPLLEKLVRQLNGAVRLVKIDVDKNQQLAGQLGIQSVPTVYAFKDGRPVDAFAGALPESQIKDFIKRHLGKANPADALAEALAVAEEMLAAGDVAGAADIFAQILGAEPENPEALGGLARCEIKAGQLDQAEQILAHAPPAIQNHAALAAAKAALDLARQAAKAGPLTELRHKLEQNPKDHQIRFDLALAYYANGENEAAVDELLEIIKRDRKWNEEAARKQLVTFFDAFGQADPLTVESRRKLSSILFS